MKKIALLIPNLLLGSLAIAQISLTGTSYTQNFDGISGGLPQGWELYTSASPASLGNNVSATKFTSGTTDWTNVSGSFKNCASANGFPNFASGTSAAQAGATDRALAIRQVGPTSTSFPGSDSAAFTFHIANTLGLTGFSGSFKLQSLDSTSPRTVTWQIEYATGSTPTTFTVVPTVSGTLTTGGLTFSNNTISFNLGSAIDNISSDVWVRIIPSGPSAGTGNRPTSGIDDFNLTWSTSGTPNYRPNIIALSPADNSVNIPVSTNSLQITFDRQVTLGTGNLNVKNVTDQTAQTIALSSSNTTIASYTATVNGINLLQGKSYYVTFDSTAFDTAGFRGVGIYDSTTWNFSTATPPPPPATSLNETFDASCGATPSSLPTGWMEYSAIGSQRWNCNSSGNNNTPGVQMNGFQGGNNANEDWLITPKLDFSAMANVYFQFDHWKRFSGNDLEILVSNNYSGIGDPNSATWTNLNVVFQAADTGTWKKYETNITAHKATPIHVAFKYVSTTTNGIQARLDNVMVSPTTSINNVSRSSLKFAVLGNGTSSNVTLGLDVKPGRYTVSIYDLAGRKMYDGVTNIYSGVQRTSISGFNLSSGMYLLTIKNDSESGITKFIVD